MVISIKNIKADVIVGTLDQERMYPQTIELDIEFEYDAGKAAETDDFNYAVDYKELTDEILEYLKGTKFYLIETLVSRITEKLKNKEHITSGKVILRKPKALNCAEYVSVEGTF
ncbi:MAG: dihydroneopterin aldolase [Candidatus Delongbacteria bacterium]|nr:dihydroneopterin aldolase [Candidatus Delongbacteria bacterium]